MLHIIAPVVEKTDDGKMHHPHPLHSMIWLQPLITDLRGTNRDVMFLFVSS